jgi:putative FmdB family regulatory protein
MPIHEYECRACGERFEALVRDANVPPCPACASVDLERLLSMFAVRSEGTRSVALQDGKRRSARVKQEKDRAQLAYEQEHTH